MCTAKFIEFIINSYLSYSLITSKVKGWMDRKISYKLESLFISIKLVRRFLPPFNIILTSPFLTCNCTQWRRKRCMCALTNFIFLWRACWSEIELIFSPCGSLHFLPIERLARLPVHKRKYVILCSDILRSAARINFDIISLAQHPAHV